MKKVLISYCTEYEAGWGQRPDGFMITTHKHRDKMMAHTNVIVDTMNQLKFFVVIKHLRLLREK